MEVEEVEEDEVVAVSLLVKWMALAHSLLIHLPNFFHIPGPPTSQGLPLKQRILLLTHSSSLHTACQRF